ncbi:MocD, partial [Pseudomonas savastanoi pv. glycinea str. race 4]
PTYFIKRQVSHASAPATAARPQPEATSG